jgi:hypothetical protein
MDDARIGKIDERDFDEIFSKIGGRRFSTDHSREERKNADFVIGNALVELKLINEEGLEKEERRRKIADIFRARQPGRPVVVLRPDLLDEDGQRRYYSAMMGPIKTHVEKANKQLKQSATDLGGDPVRVLLLVNNGYAALSHEEFKDIAVRRTCNATHNIDAVVVAGMYFYSDTFDHYFFPRMDLFPIRVDRPFSSYDKLLAEWQAFGEGLLTRSCILDEDTHAEKRLPVQELIYNLDDVTFVMPAPPMGEPSGFFRNGRPRKNSSGIDTCPTVARTFPDFDAASWQRFRDHLTGDDFFKDSYSDWIRFRQEQEKALGAPTKPFVPVRVTFDEWSEWCKEENCAADVRSLCEFANTLFDAAVHRLIEEAKDQGESPIVVPRFVLLVTEVIGQDKANDLSSVYLIKNDIAGERSIPLVENERIYFEHGVALASVYAFKHGVHAIMYRKDETNAWI